VQWLQTKGVVSSNALESCQKSYVDILTDEYSEYLAQERGLASTSIEAYASIARKFLANTCPRGRSQINSLSAQEISGFIQHQANKRWSQKWLGLLATAVRSFLRFAQYAGYTNSTKV
jgi:integrase/recombinase XerD